jgi:hypothetical protein
VFKQPTPSVVFVDLTIIIKFTLKFKIFIQVMSSSSSSSSSTNTGNKGSSRGSNGPSRGGTPPTPIFPNVITAAGSPPGNQPPVVNTIVQAFSKQRVNKDKIAKRDAAHVDTRLHIVQFLAAPTSHNDPLRTLSVDQLSELNDEDLVGQSLHVLTTDNLGGSLRLADGSAISMRECILELANNSKTRDNNAIKRRLKERLNALQAIAEVERYKKMDDGDDINSGSGDDFSGDGILDFDDEPSSSVKRKVHSTVAEATVGKKQVRHADKRPHQPTNRLGVNVALKDRHVVYATANRSFKGNIRLLTVPGAHSKSVPKPAAVALLVFPGTVLPGLDQVASSDLLPPTSAKPVSTLCGSFCIWPGRWCRWWR